MSSKIEVRPVVGHPKPAPSPLAGVVWAGHTGAANTRHLAMPAGLRGYEQHWARWTEEWADLAEALAAIESFGDWSDGPEPVDIAYTRGNVYDSLNYEHPATDLLPVVALEAFCRKVSARSQEQDVIERSRLDDIADASDALWSR